MTAAKMSARRPGEQHDAELAGERGAGAVRIKSGLDALDEAHRKTRGERRRARRRYRPARREPT
jgi:hypothetical protein